MGWTTLAAKLSDLPKLSNFEFNNDYLGLENAKESEIVYLPHGLIFGLFNISKLTTLKLSVVNNIWHIPAIKEITVVLSKLF